MYRSLAAGRRVRLDHVGIFADGVAVREVGALAFAMARGARRRRHPRDERRDLRRHQGRVRRHAQRDGAGGRVVGRGAQELGGARGAPADRPLAAVLSGANTNFHRLRFVAERAELGEAREALLGVTIPERPGAFRDFCAAIGRREVTEFNYRLSGREEAHIFVGLRTVVARGRRGRAGAPARVRLPGGRPLAERDGEAARAPPGGRPRLAARATSGSTGSSSRSGRAHCSSSWRSSAGASTSACSTTATTAPTSAACWRRSRCRRATSRRSRPSWSAWATPGWRRRRTSPSSCSCRAPCGPSTVRHDHAAHHLHRGAEARDLAVARLLRQRVVRRGASRPGPSRSSLSSSCRSVLRSAFE